jgi:hypothetical protein
VINPPPDAKTDSSGDEANRWPRTRAIIRSTICWIALQFRDNFPHYLIPFFTLLLVIFAWYAWEEAKEGTKALRGQLDVLRAEQRPWVSLGGLGINDVNRRPAVGQDFYIFVNWRNFGRDPAFHTKVTYKFSTTQPMIPLPPCENCGDGDVMLPGIPITRTPHIDGAELTREVFGGIQAGTTKMWFVLRIDYVDGERTPHKTFICYNFVWDGSFIDCGIPGSNYAN